jgi:hypothetical protein
MSNNLNRSRVVVNKYTDTPSDIISGVCTDGEIVISTKKGNEGLYIKNNINEIVKIGENTHQYLSESQYEKLIKDGEVLVIGEDGKQTIIKYDKNIYYMVYEDVVDPDFSLNTIILEDNYIPDNTIILNGGVKTLDLNGNSILAPIFIDESDNSTNSYGLWVKGGEVTIKGEGEIIAQDAMYSMAIWANGGTVVISNGTFRNAGESCDLIYASNGGKVIIHGGEFIATPKGSEAGTGNDYSALNIKNSDREISSITVYGGRFYGFNPADNVSEGEHTNFVAEGYKSVQNGDWWEVIKDK